MEAWFPCADCTRADVDAGCNYVECLRGRRQQRHFTYRAEAGNHLCPHCAAPLFHEGPSAHVRCPVCCGQYEVRR